MQEYFSQSGFAMSLYKSTKDLFSSWIEENIKLEDTDTGNRFSSEYGRGRSVEELTLELDQFRDNLMHFIALYQDWRNLPTRRKNEELKNSLAFVRFSYIAARKILYEIDKACINGNGPYELGILRETITLYKASGIEPIKAKYKDNSWEYNEKVEEYLKNVNIRNRYIRKNNSVIPFDPNKFDTDISHIVGNCTYDDDGISVNDKIKVRKAIISKLRVAILSEKKKIETLKKAKKARPKTVKRKIIIRAPKKKKPVIKKKTVQKAKVVRVRIDNTPRFQKAYGKYWDIVRRFVDKKHGWAYVDKLPNMLEIYFQDNTGKEIEYQESDDVKGNRWRPIELSEGL